MLRITLKLFEWRTFRAVIDRAYIFNFGQPGKDENIKLSTLKRTLIRFSRPLWVTTYVILVWLLDKPSQLYLSKPLRPWKLLAYMHPWLNLGAYHFWRMHDLFPSRFQSVDASFFDLNQRFLFEKQRRQWISIIVTKRFTSARFSLPKLMDPFFKVKCRFFLACRFVLPSFKFV